MYFGQFKLIHLDDVFIHWKKFNFCLLHSGELIFGRGHDQCQDFVYWNPKVILEVKVQRWWRHLRFLSILTIEKYFCKICFVYNFFVESFNCHKFWLKFDIQKLPLFKRCGGKRDGQFLLNSYIKENSFLVPGI